jgi:mycofactocin precursor
MGSAPNDPAKPAAENEDQDLVEQDLLVEDVSIDGMCGVY